ncbi:hypothetical protein LTR94_033395, partial [Friedmanniomyces endolithicus]
SQVDRLPDPGADGAADRVAADAPGSGPARRHEGVGAVRRAGDARRLLRPDAGPAADGVGLCLDRMGRGHGYAAGRGDQLVRPVHHSASALHRTRFRSRSPHDGVDGHGRAQQAGLGRDRPGRPARRRGAETPVPGSRRRAVAHDP